jgi:hypothetical protein
MTAVLVWTRGCLSEPEQDSVCERSCAWVERGWLIDCVWPACGELAMGASGLGEWFDVVLGWVA